MPYGALDRTTAEAAPVVTLGDPRAGASGLTLLNIRAELLKLLLNRTDVPPARLDLYTNFAYVDMVTSLKIEEMRGSLEIPLVADQSLYLLPDCVFAIEQAVAIEPQNVNQDEGIPLEISDLKSYRARPTTTGPIRDYFRHTDMLVVWPLPDYSGAASIVIDFWIRPTWLVDDADQPILGSEWHEALLYLARQKLFDGLQEFEAAMAANNTYINLVRRRLDTRKLEEDNKEVRSSVPRSESMRRFKRRNPIRGDN